MLRKECRQRGCASSLCMPMQGKAELRALAKKTLRGSQRSELLEGAYHRYAFHDTGLPKWFQEDEKRHMRYASLAGCLDRWCSTARLKYSARVGRPGKCMQPGKICCQ